MQSVVKLKPHMSFTETDKEIVKAFLRKEAFPQLYTNSVFKSLVYIDTLLVDTDSIKRNGPGSSQSIRYSGINPKRDDLKQDLIENGYQLYQRPISLRKLSDGTLVFLDGRTKDSILSEMSIKNRIVNVYQIDDSEAEEFGERLNAGEDSPPAGLILEEDLVGCLHRRIDEGNLACDLDEIKLRIDKICGKGRFSASRRHIIASQVFHHEIATQNKGLLPVAWANAKQVKDHLATTRFKDSQNVIYFPYSSTSAPKCIPAAAELAFKNPDKQIRIVIFVSYFTGYDIKKSYIDSILKFKHSYETHLNRISNTYFEGKSPLNDRILLYGAVGSRIENLCEDINELIIFGKNDQKINSSYLTNSNLNSFFHVEDDNEQD